MSLKLKTIAGIAAIEVLLLAFLVVSSLGFMRETNEDLFLERARIAKLLFATMVTDPVISNDVSTIDAFVEHALKNKEIIYVRVRDSQGRVLAAGGDAIALASPFVPDTSWESARADGRFDAETHVIVAGKPFGRVEMGLSLANTEATIQLAQRWLFTIAGAEVVLVAMFSLLLGSYLTNRLAKLRDAARQVTRGQYGVVVDERGRDEVSEFSRCFNEMSRELKRVTDELGEAVRQAQLARKDAEEESKAKSRFLAVMSHEIRTPMNGVLGLANALGRETLTPEQHDLVRLIETSGESLVGLLNDILDYSKLANGNLVLEQVPFQLGEVATTTYDLMREAATLKGIELTNIGDLDRSTWVQGDVARLRQTLVNLVSNAIKFTEIGKVTIETRTISHSEEKVLIEWRVKDSGIGIPPESLATIFESFAQADSSIARRFGGTGLGLAICKNLIEAMGGEISVVSEVGAGSTFTIRVPFAVITPARKTLMDELPSERALEDFIRANNRPLRLLVVDDNKTNLIVAAKLLARTDALVETAADGREAVEKVLQSQYDAILMDMQMPVMDGPQAAAKMRLNGCLTPIIGVSANAFDEDRQKCLDAGMNDFIAKPLRYTDLICVLDGVLTRSSPDAVAHARKLGGAMRAA